MQKFFKILSLTFATGFGSGYLPWAPGSWGSAVALIASWWLLDLPIEWFLIIIILLFIIGVAVAGSADKYFGNKDGGSKSDNDQIVIDEWVGMLITLLPLFYFEVTLLHLGMAFLFFRIFDAAKFGITKIADGWHNRWGVMLDDVSAGVHAGIFFTIALWMMYLW